MSDVDKISYMSLRTLDALARDDHDAFLRVCREAEAQGYDGFDVATHLGSMLLHLMQRSPDWREQLDGFLEQGKLFADAELPDVGDVFGTDS